MAALELISGFVTAPGATLTALTMSSGDSLTVRLGTSGRKILLLNAWTDNQSAGILRIRSPRLHDNVQCMRFDAYASIVRPVMPWGIPQGLYSQDTLTVELSGSGVAGDIETACLLIYYEDLPGIAGRFIDRKTLQSRMVNIMTVENTLSLGTAGGWSGAEAINAEYDLFEANTDYALMGYLVSAECAAVRWRGSDTGNIGVGGPGDDSDQYLTSSWFVRLSDQYGLPLIPVFNSANKASIYIEGAQDENGVDVTVSSIFAQLK